MSLLNVRNLCKEYGVKASLVKALNNVTLEVNEGEFVAIVGASGSGKSTLMHIIGGVDKPSSGDVIVNSVNIYKLNNTSLARYRRCDVGLIYQFYNLIPILTVKENIVLPLSLDKRKVNIDLLDNLISLLGLNNRINHLPNELSGGEQQRVAIARSIITRPKLILADEPTGNLDSKNSLEILNLLKMLNKEFNQTIIMITHDIKLASNASRIITLKDGMIINDEVNYEFIK